MVKDKIFAAEFPDIARTGYLYQLTRGRRLIDIPHSHDFYELMCVVEGGCDHVVNGEAHRMDAGDAVLLRVGDTHFFADQTAGTNLMSMSVESGEMRKFLSAYSLPDSETVFFRLPGPELPRFGLLCGETFDCPSSERAPYCRSILGGLLSALALSEVSARGRIPPDFRQVLREMNRLGNAREGVAAFLRLSNFSHAQLCRLTARYLGTTPSGYVTGVRMRFAWEMVTSGSADYAEIAEEVGYSSLSNFSSLFRRTYGMTLSAARKHAVRTV